MIERRTLIKGLISLVAAPAIVRYQSIMPVKVFNPATSMAGWGLVGDTWHHLAEVDGQVYYDGRLAVIGDVFPTAITADRAFWSRALSQREIAALAFGARPALFMHKLASWYPGDGLRPKDD